MPLANEFGQLVRENPSKQIDIIGLEEVFFDGNG
jgi:hypothetical protein